MVKLILCLALAQGPEGAELKAAAPVQGLAVIGKQGTLAITRVSPVCGHGRDGELWLPRPGQKPGEKGEIKATVTRLMVTVIELPANVVEAYTVDGEARAGLTGIEPAKLKELLAKERMVLVALDGRKVDPFYLQLYKEGTIVLVPPGNIGGLDQDGYGVVPAPFPKIEFPPDKSPFPKEPPEDKKRPGSGSDKEVSLIEDGEGAEPPNASGGIAGVLQAREKLPGTLPPSVSDAALKGDAVELTLQAPVLEQIKVQEVINQNGKEVVVERVVTRRRSMPVKRLIRVTALKSFAVTKDGTLERLEAGKVEALLKKRTPVLIGFSEEVDRRHLELIRPGTLYIALPQAPVEKEDRRPKRDEKIPLPRRAVGADTN